MARIFLDEMGGINQGGILASYGLPMSPFSTEEYAPTIVETPSSPARTRRKQSKPKPKRNDGIIRNHDSVWDYKIQDGKLLTRRKTSNGNWIDITSNDEARQRIEQFTGRSISNKQSASNNSSQSSKPASVAKSNNSSLSQRSTPANSTQTQQTVSPATTQATRQQAVRQDSTKRDTTVTVVSQPRSLTATPASNAEPDWQNMTDAELDAYFGNSPLNGVTKVAKGNPSKRIQLLSNADLRANGWHWSNGQSSFGDKDTDNFNLLNSARNKVEAGDNILLDSNGAVVPTSEVHRYINRGRIPLYISDYDAQFYQPQSEAGTIADIRRAQDARRNRDFDNQRNMGLATMFGAPVLAASLATAPAATLLALGGSELVGAGFEGAWKHGTGKSWAESLGGNDPNAQFYANMIQPGRIIGGTLGAGVANATQPARQAISEAIANGYNKIIGNGEMPSFLGLLQRQLYANKPTGFRLPSMQQQISSMKVAMPKISRKLSGNVNKTRSLADAKAATKEYWESRQPYKVTIKEGKDGRLYPKFNVKKANTKFNGYPQEYPLLSEGLIQEDPLYLMRAYEDMLPYGSREAVNMLKDNFNIMYNLPAGYWQSVRPVPTYVDSPRFGGIVIN